MIAVGQTVITGNTITIGNAQASNAGSYICVAQNQFEKDQASTTVNVIGKCVCDLNRFKLFKYL